MFTQFRSAAAALAVAMACAPAQAAIKYGDGSATLRPELLLMIWDPTTEVSYTRDLGILAYADSIDKSDPTKNLFVYGQQNEAYQKIFDPLNSDTNFQKFLTESKNKTDIVWAIFGGSTNEELTQIAGNNAGYFTVKHAAPTGTLDPDYAKLMAWSNENFSADWGPTQYYLADLNNGNFGATSAYNSHNTVDNGSSFNVKGEAQYVGTLFSNGPNAGVGSTAPSFFNKINMSSWFYYATNSSDVGGDPVLVDEFDNGVLGNGHDAYWGLGVDANGNYILSYTMEAALTQAQTAVGRQLRLRTDFAASYGRTRLIDVPGDGLDLGGNVSPVPEPSTWGLMGLGLALVAARARRQKRA